MRRSTSSRSVCRAFVTTAVVALASAAFAASATAGTTSGTAPLTVVKTVSGPVPAGTTFTAVVQCDSPIINDGGGGTDSATVTFDSTGQPTSADTVTFGDPGSCTVTETQSGGAASTTYACESTVPEAPIGSVGAQQVEAICDAAGPQAAPIGVNIVNEGQTATVTISNTFTDPATPIPAAAAVVAQPAFTG